MSRNVEITILGQTYVVRSDQDEAHLKEVARFVDTKLGELTKGGRVSTVGIAVIGALNIANEYFSYRRHMDTVLEQLEEKTNRLAEIMEQKVPTMDSEPPGPPPKLEP